MKLTQIEKEMLEILEDTKNFYSKDTSKRAIDPSTENCAYLDSKGRKCAVGRFLTKKDIENIDSNVGLSGDINDVWLNIDNPKIKNIPIEFWEELQKLHDKSENWDIKGITKYGKELFNHIKKKIVNNKYKVV